MQIFLRFSCVCRFFVVPLRQNLNPMMTFRQFWDIIKIRKWGKYVVTLLAFLIVFLFVGEQSLLHFVHRHREIRRMEEQRDLYRAESEKVEREIKVLQDADSLERFAREHYYMHTPNEDIFLVEEE